MEFWLTDAAEPVPMDSLDLHQVGLWLGRRHCCAQEAL